MLNHLLRPIVLCRRHTARLVLEDVIKSTCRRLSTAVAGAKDKDKDQGSLITRPPVVTIMGHVDHGKTTLIDHLRNSKIVEQEFGGITQHIGAFVVPFKTGNSLELVTFIDTPGHAAFSSMRRRGANVTDIVVLVVAVDDGILDQTVESIQAALDNQVPVIVAVNKIDKYPEDRLQKRVSFIRRQLVVHNLVTEAEGGDTQLVEISALKGTGVDHLKEAILALADTLDLKVEVDCPARGSIIESKLDPHRGKLCTVLVQEGTVNKGDVIVAGSYNYAKVRALFDERNQLRQQCGPGLPIQVVGWREEVLPAAGETIVQVESEQVARKIVADYKQAQMELRSAEDSEAYQKRAEEHYKRYKKKLIEKRAAASKYRYGRIMFNPRGQRPKESEEESEEAKRKINLILKCDVDGSLDALLELLDTYERKQKQLVKLDIIHHGVGSITESDLQLATTFDNCLIYGFNVKYSDQKLANRAKQEGVQVVSTNVIYHLIDDLRARIIERIPEFEREVECGSAQVLQEFVVKEGKRKTRVAGARCTRGYLRKSSLYKLIRNEKLVAKNLVVSTLKHLKDEVEEVQKGSEFGVSFAAAEDNATKPKAVLEFKPGDLLIGYEREKYKPLLEWNLKGFV